MQEKKNLQKMKKKNLREREREPFFVWKKYAQNGREWKIYSKMMRIRKTKIKKDKWGGFQLAQLVKSLMVV